MNVLLSTQWEMKTMPDLQSLIDSLPFYVIIVNEDHEIVLANKAVEQKLNVELRDIIGKYCPKVIHGSDGPVHFCPLEASAAHNKPIEFEYFEPSMTSWISSAIYPIEGMVAKNKRLFFHMVQDIDQRKRTEAELLQTVKRLDKVIHSTVKAITKTVEKRDPYTSGHQQRVSRLGEEIAKLMGLSDEQVAGIVVAGLVHDIGKIAVPLEILSKPGKINVYEYHLIKDHSETGYDILKEIEFPWPVAEIVLQHHERMDGSGYPRGLKGNEIIQEARVLSVADVVEAMSSHRPYRQAFGMEFALNEIKKNKGIMYDPDAVEACLEVIQKGFYFA
ncbi:HD domain-containing protein [Dehalobacter sp. DCM]|uniref:HD-GYP domain-containing protein n=1 Tax=Dehalobacter sp. DCM TaxID=2907827 RepID=UPI003081DF8D|nr:HD domain-containing protein [Dehalobacter sp. DCM]